MEPINYTAMMPQVDLSRSVMSGLQVGGAIKEMQASRDAQKLKEQYAADLTAVMNKPSASGFAALVAKYPGQQKALGEAYSMLSKEQQDSEFKTGAQIYHALESGRGDVAMSVIDGQIEALKNSGQDASDMTMLKDVMTKDPNSALAHLGLFMSSSDPDRWAKMMQERRASQEAPANLNKAQSEAYKAAVAAKFAESKAALDLEKKGWDITKLQTDISLSKQNTAIAAMNAQLAKETNQLKRDELQQKINAANLKRDSEVRDKVATVETARSSIDNMLNTADRILGTSLDTVGSAAGPISSKIPTTSQDTADFEELVTSLGSQAFMAQIPGMKGMGALSNAEGEKLQSSLQSLSLRQSPEQLLRNVKEAQRLMLKARDNLATRYGVPDTIPDRPEVKTTPEANTSEIPVPSTTGFRVLGVE